MSAISKKPISRPSAPKNVANRHHYGVRPDAKGSGIKHAKAVDINKQTYPTAIFSSYQEYLDSGNQIADQIERGDIKPRI